MNIFFQTAAAHECFFLSNYGRRYPEASRSWILDRTAREPQDAIFGFTWKALWNTLKIAEIPLELFKLPFKSLEFPLSFHVLFVKPSTLWLSKLLQN